MNDLNMIKEATFRFDPLSCRSANIPLQEAKLLRWIFLAERSSTDIDQTFGLGMANKLLRQGYVDNPLGEQGTAHTNLWKLTEDGLNILKELTGVKS
jgi:hypothetical protein